MTATARAVAHDDEQYLDAAPSPTPNTYGGRVPLQPELGIAIQQEALLARLRKELRRLRSGFTRVELRVSIAILVLAGYDNPIGVCYAALEQVRALARCSRGALFDALARLEGLGVIEEREIVRPHFEACEHTELAGWAGFHECKRKRQAARRAGAPYGCVAHHGKVVIRWQLPTAADLVAALENEPPRPLRRKRYRTATEKPYRTPTAPRSRDPYRTPNPGLTSLKSDSDPFSSSPNHPSAGAGEPDEIPGTGSRADGPLRVPPPPALHGRPDEAERRAETQAPLAPASVGFASGDVAESESNERGGASPGPSAPATSEVSAVLRAHREHVLGSNLSDLPASGKERALVARALGTFTVAELVLAMRGIARAIRAGAETHRGRLVWLLDADGVHTQHAIDGELEAQRKARERRRSATATLASATVQVVTDDAAIAAHRAGIERRQTDLRAAWCNAFGQPDKQAALEAEYLEAFGEPMRERGAS